LQNTRWEAFCQYYAGSCWGNATRAYTEAGYKAKNRNVAKSSGYKLLQKTEIEERVKFLRKKKLDLLGIDQNWIAEQRKIIAEMSSKERNRLQALKDLEKGLGLLPDAKLRIEHSGDIKVIFEGKKDETV
jgi:phage terminase small subunit